MGVTFFEFMRQYLHSAIQIFALLACCTCVTVTAASTREVLQFDADWQFALGDHPDAKASDFNASTWRTLNVPHDWAFEADYEATAAQGANGGYKPGGIGWYHKRFDLPSGWQGKLVSLQFDAVYMNSEVWINGHYLGKRPYGYIPFQHDLSEYLVSGKNSIAVRVDSRLEPSARWYHGCGIYGHVNLVATDAVHIPKDGIYVRTPGATSRAATVLVDTELKNASQQKQRFILRSQILNSDGRVVAESRENVDLAAGGSRTVAQAISLNSPELWSVDSPTRYTLLSTLSTGDEVLTRFGVRDIRWMTDTGFWLNGENIKLLGVADHLEAGPVGAAIPDELNRWKIQLLKDMGCNAIRVAHNPQVPAFYDLCDELGMLVMDEIFDGWSRKAKEDYGKQAFKEWWERDLRAWLKANRNHPSVIIWSLGNETGGQIAKSLVEVCHEMDPTRPTTSGHSGSNHMDVYGVNGGSESPEFFKKKRPSKPFVSTEAPHTWQVRGYYRSQTWYRDGPKTPNKVFPLPDLTEEEIFTYDWIAPDERKNRKQIFNSSYDNATVRITARKNWELMRDLPWYSGHFRWTGFDYVGEAGYVHGGWPFRAFMGGALDLAGFEKDLYYFYQSQWTTEPMVHILPHWTHPKMKLGTLVPVWVYSNCDEVELFFNGQSLGKDRPGTKWDEMQCDWMVPWAPGKLLAVGYKNGREVMRAEQATAGVPAQLELSVEGKDYPIVTVRQEDTNGVLNPYGENRIYYHVDGSARILSLESGNPVNIENHYGQNSRTAFFGLARCFLENTSNLGDVSLVAGSILGEKQLMTSNTISIDVCTLSIRGAANPGDVKILYSVDGSKPTREYTGAFEVIPNTTVKAIVSRGGQTLFEMSERFGPNEGLHWGSLEDMKASAANAGGDQAEDVLFEKAKVSKSGKGYHGKGYLDFGSNKGAFVEWYQENDGTAGPANLKIRYSGHAKKRTGREMRLTVNGSSQIIFFPNTKDYGTDWKELELKIQLKAGANNIRLTTTESGGMCIDEITVR